METSQRRLAVTFRPMTIADIPSVHEIDVLSFSMPWSERSYRFEVIENRSSVIWVAEAARQDTGDQAAPEIAGMIVIWAIVDEAHVATIAVHPDFRGHGIGHRLLAHGLLAAYERGARSAYLEVRRSNVIAQKMYRQFGFYVVGERPRYYQDNNEDALLMNLDELQPEVLRHFAES